MHLLTLHTAVGLGITNQFRAMGSALFIAIATSIFNGSVKSGLSKQLGIKDAGSFIDNSHGVQGLPPEILDVAWGILVQGYNREMWLVCGVGAAQVLTGLLMWKKSQIRPA